MMDVFFLLLQKMVRNSIQSVTSQLVITDKDVKQVQLDTAFNVDDFVFTLAHLLTLQNGFTNCRLNIPHAT